MIDNEWEEVVQQEKHNSKLRKLAAEEAREIEKRTINWANETCSHDQCTSRPDWKILDAEKKYPIGISYCSEHGLQMLSSSKEQIFIAARLHTGEQDYEIVCYDPETR